MLSAPFRPVHQPDHDAWFRDIRSRKDVAIFGIGALPITVLSEAVSCTRSTRFRDPRSCKSASGVASARGLGIGTAACRALLRYAFDDLNLRRVHLHVLDTNVAAKRLYEKVGFRVQGVERDAVFIDGRSRDLVTMAISRP